MALYLTPRQVAERWSCDASTVRRMCRSGELVAMRLGLESWRIAVAAVEAYELAHRTADAAGSDAPPKPEAPKEVSYSTTVDGFALPADYRPVFPELWPGHEVAGREKRLSAGTKNR